VERDGGDGFGRASATGRGVRVRGRFEGARRGGTAEPRGQRGQRSGADGRGRQRDRHGGQRVQQRRRWRRRMRFRFMTRPCAGGRRCVSRRVSHYRVCHVVRRGDAGRRDRTSLFRFPFAGTNETFSAARIPQQLIFDRERQSARGPSGGDAESVDGSAGEPSSPVAAVPPLRFFPTREKLFTRIRLSRFRREPFDGIFHSHSYV